MEWYWIVAIVVGSLAILLALSNIFYKQFFKRFYDVVLSGIALIVLSPLLLILTIVGAIAMGGNPFFVQPRPGRIDTKTGKERIFSLVKFRTMSNKKDSDGNLLPDSVRLNKYGKFLRSTSLAGVIIGTKNGMSYDSRVCGCFEDKQNSGELIRATFRSNYSYLQLAF